MHDWFSQIRSQIIMASTPYLGEENLCINSTIYYSNWIMNVPMYTLLYTQQTCALLHYEVHTWGIKIIHNCIPTDSAPPGHFCMATASLSVAGHLISHSVSFSGRHPVKVSIDRPNVNLYNVTREKLWLT